MAPPCPIKEHFEKSPCEVPSSWEAGERGCFGQCSGKKGTGLYCAAGEHVLESGWSGAWERKEERKQQLFGVCLLLHLSQQNISGASHLGHIFSESEYLRKVRTFSETEQVRGHREEQNYKTGGNVKVDTQPPKLKVFGFSDPAWIALWPLLELLNTHSSNYQVVPWKSLGWRFRKQQWSPQGGLHKSWLWLSVLS